MTSLQRVLLVKDCIDAVKIRMETAFKNKDKAAAAEAFDDIVVLYAELDKEFATLLASIDKTVNDLYEKAS